MKYLLNTLFILLFFACSDPTEIITKKNTETLTVVKDQTTEFCNYEIVNMWCYNANNETWFICDVSAYTEGQSTIELTIVHVGGDITESITVSARKNGSIETPNSASARYNQYNGIMEINTDENGIVEIQHHYGVEEARKINLSVRLTMIRK